MKTFQVLVILAALCICQSANSQTPSDIQVLHATYGARGQQIDVTTKVQSLVQSGQTNVRVGTHLFGKDPVFGQTKTLYVLFSSNGVQYDTDIREGRQLSFSNAHQLNVAPRAPAAPISPGSTVQGGAPSPPPPPEQHRLAPEGTLYLMERVVVKSDSGVSGFAPGTRVKLIEDRGEKLFVKNDDNIKFEAPSDKVTNDLDLAVLVARQDAQSQQALAQDMKERMDAYRAGKEKEIPLYDQQQREVEARREAAANAAKGNNPLDREAYHEKVSYPWWWHRHPYIYVRSSSKH
ncbi:MAG: hypothetical protein DME43_02950 [Verrucomicrobia bacterium]|nr:MAG: hypothetical protein DME43_02950 [Verrucomicrobiota bacterium]